MMRELVSENEIVKFVWDNPRLEIDEVHIYRYKLNDGSDGYYYDNIMHLHLARRFWERLVAKGFKLQPLCPPSSYEN